MSMVTLPERSAIKNATPKRYRTKFIEPGLADYSAEGFGTVLVTKEALDRMLPSFVGKPVFLKHKDVSPEEAFLNNGDPDSADGVVSEVGYDEKVGWYWADLMIWDDETQDAIENRGHSVSCAYDVSEADGAGGSYHNIPFDQTVFNGEYTHMAIVDNPRYEDATILRNAKTPGGNMKKRIFRFLGAKVQNEAPPVEEKEDEGEMINAAESMIEIDGQQIPLSELIACYKAEKTEAPVMNADDEIDVDGNKVKVGDMVNAYRNKKNALANAEPAQDVVAEDVVDEKKQLQNAAPVKPNDNFKKVQNAAVLDATPTKPVISTRSDRLAHGATRYGSKKDGEK